MTDILIHFLVAGGLMALIDALWLSVIANKLYKSQLGSLLLDKPNMPAAVAFYIIYVIGIVAFVITPALEKNSWQYALGFGALFGLVAYATYDLTNLATLKSWPVKLVFIDLLWGAFLTAAVSVLTYFVITHWFS